MISIVEIPMFSRRIEGVMTPDELTAFKDFIARIIYYFHSDDIPLFLITAYRKVDKGRLAKAERNELRGLGKQLADYYGK